MVVTPQPPRSDRPFVVARVGAKDGIVSTLSEHLAGGKFTVTSRDDFPDLLQWIRGDRPGPDCVVVAETVDDPLALATAVSREAPLMPSVVCTSQPEALATSAVVEADVDAVITAEDLHTPADVRERIGNLAGRYRRTVSARRDASLLDTLFETLPVELFAKDRDGRFVRTSSGMSQPQAGEPSGPGDDSGPPPDDSAVLETGDPIVHRERKREDGSWELVSKVPWYDAGELVGLAGIRIDVTDRKRHEQKLTATTQLLSAIVNTSPAAIVVHDVDGTVQYWNPAATDLFGWSAEDAIREPYPPYVQPEKRAEFESHVETVVESGSIGPVEVRRRTSDGELLDLQLSAAAVGEDDPRIVTVITDVTALKERERRLKRQNERLETFTRVLAHDLRNPIQVLRGQFEARKQGRSMSEEVLERTLDRMEAIVDDVLSVAREEPLVSDRTRLSLATEAQEAWDTLEATDATLCIESDCTFDGDPTRIQRLLVHLFENAVEHGGSDVTVSVGRTDGGFFVADDGAGIDVDRADQLFEPGYSTEPHATGFGLNVVREVAQAHDWTVEISETDEGGTRVQIRGVDGPHS